MAVRAKALKGSLAEDLILLCTGGRITSRTAQRAIRALCRHHGGLLLYIPRRMADGEAAEKLRGVIADEVGDADAEIILAKIMSAYGNMQVYIPMEKMAFKKTIALEIFERSGKNDVTISDLAREYGVSFSQAYNLWYLGQREKLKPSMPYLPFAELPEDNNSF